MKTKRSKRLTFPSFDVGSSYHTEAEFGKRWIVHPLNLFCMNIKPGGNSGAIQRDLLYVSIASRLNSGLQVLSGKITWFGGS